jgi:fatty acid/phospholipid biosynthesis enzyme
MSNREYRKRGASLFGGIHFRGAVQVLKKMRKSARKSAFFLTVEKASKIHQTEFNSAIMTNCQNRLKKGALD